MLYSLIIFIVVGSISEGPVFSQPAVNFNKAKLASSSSQQKLSDATNQQHNLVATFPADNSTKTSLATNNSPDNAIKTSLATANSPDNAIKTSQAQLVRNSAPMTLTDTHAPLRQSATQLQSPFVSGLMKHGKLVSEYKSYLYFT